MGDFSLRQQGGGEVTGAHVFRQGAVNVGGDGFFEGVDGIGHGGRIWFETA